MHITTEFPRQTSSERVETCTLKTWYGLGMSCLYLRKSKHEPRIKHTREHTYTFPLLASDLTHACAPSLTTNRNLTKTSTTESNHSATTTLATTPHLGKSRTIAKTLMTCSTGCGHTFTSQLSCSSSSCTTATSTSGSHCSWLSDTPYFTTSPSGDLVTHYFFVSSAGNSLFHLTLCQQVGSKEKLIVF